jgi:hypothetical protein
MGFCLSLSEDWSARCLHLEAALSDQESQAILDISQANLTATKITSTAPSHLTERNLMSKIDDEFTLIESKLSGFITQDGMTIEVCIYRGDAERTWQLEVVNEEGTSIVWDGRFETDQAAMDEVKHSIKTEGMTSFLSDPDETKH